MALADEWASAGATPFLVSFHPASVVMKVPYEFFLGKKLRHRGGNGVAVAANARAHHLPIECNGAHHLIFKCTREPIALTTTAMEACLLGW
ncbi:hypothetical protein D3C79_887140 [compost metagenome]